eukprot:TCALIF_03712-PA protein Name:"Similar to ttk Protein tramtrack, beta isoform (Drosophila melanogaster)" AED:0.00 eAED:0.00 QI:0/0.66/0.75/0.75/1/1/4/2707/653
MQEATTFSVVEGRENNHNTANRNFKRMGSEKYKLKWSRYESNILSAFHSLLESETLSDVTLFCEGQTFKAHRLVLAACSTHFESLFSQTPINAPSTNQFFVILDGTRADDLQILLHFMYRGEAYLHQDRINSVLRTAEALQVKGLSEGPRGIELNNQNAHGPGNNGRSWSPHPQQPFVGDSPHHQRHKKKDLDDHSQMRERHHGSPPPSMHSSTGEGMAQSYYAPPPITREPFPMYSGSIRSTSSYSRTSRDDHRDQPARFSPLPHNRSKSPGPPPPPGRYPLEKFNSPPHGPSGLLPSSSVDLPSKEERDTTPISVVSAPEIYEGRSISRGHDSDRPPSNKTDTHSPEYERQTPTMSSPLQKTGFPSDSTTDPASGAGPSGLLRSAFKTEEQNRLRRSSDPGAPGMNNEADAGDRATPSDDHRPKFPPEFRNVRDDLSRMATSSPQGRTNDMRMMEDDARTQAAATSLEQFRRLAQAQEHLMPRRVHQGGLSALVPGLTASDYMRFAMPVRDPDNGDPISGSGTKLKCPFCERTYGYETNLRAHIRQRHQGIRVSCPYCPRTFTRNNTVRRHVQREHRHLAGRIPTKFGSTRVMPDPITSGVGAGNNGGGALPHHAMPPSPLRSGSPIPTSSGVGSGPGSMDTSGMGKSPHP